MVITVVIPKISRPNHQPNENVSWWIWWPGELLSSFAQMKLLPTFKEQLHLPSSLIWGQLHFAYVYIIYGTEQWAPPPEPFFTSMTMGERSAGKLPLDMFFVSHPFVRWWSEPLHLGQSWDLRVMILKSLVCWKKPRNGINDGFAHGLLDDYFSCSVLLVFWSNRKGGCFPETSGIMVSRFARWWWWWWWWWWLYPGGAMKSSCCILFLSSKNIS